MKKNLIKLSVAVGVTCFWLLVWWGLSLIVASELLLPSPVVVLSRMWEHLLTADFYIVAALSLLRILTGCAAGLLLGVLVAYLTYKSKIANALLSPFLSAVRSTPVASFILLALVWLGRDSLPSLISALIVFPVVWANITEGLLRIDPSLRSIVTVFGLPRSVALKRLYIPSVMPYFLSSCRVSVGLAWKAGVAAEVLAVPARAVGSELYLSKVYLDTPELFAWTAVVIVLSIIIEKLLGLVISRAASKYNTVAQTENGKEAALHGAYNA